MFLQYYALDITYFKSSLDSHLLDLLWNKYWVNTLSSSPLLGNGDYVAGQISDLGAYIMILVPDSFSFPFFPPLFQVIYFCKSKNYHALYDPVQLKSWSKQKINCLIPALGH